MARNMCVALVLGAMPNVYVYVANNPSESIIAKRRGYGAAWPMSPSTSSSAVDPGWFLDVHGIT